MITNECAEHDVAYKNRLLKIMRENNQLGISNDIYVPVISAFINNKATFAAVYGAPFRTV